MLDNNRTLYDAIIKIEGREDMSYTDISRTANSYEGKPAHSDAIDHLYRIATSGDRRKCNVDNLQIFLDKLRDNDDSVRSDGISGLRRMVQWGGCTEELMKRMIEPLTVLLDKEYDEYNANSIVDVLKKIKTTTIDPATKTQIKIPSLEEIEENLDYRNDPKFAFGLGMELSFYLRPFSGLDSDERYVPPHPDDVEQHGSTTSPVEIRDNYPVFSPSFYLDLRAKFHKQVRIKNRFSIAPFPVMAKSWGYEGDNIDSEGKYTIPPLNRTRYASGENAFTYISIGKIFTNDLTMRVWPMDSRSKYGGVDVGLSLIAIEHIYGWDRYASTEIESRRYHVYPGLTASLSGFAAYGEGDFSWAWKYVSINASVYFSDVPIWAISISGLVPVIFGNELQFNW